MTLTLVQCIDLLQIVEFYMYSFTSVYLVLCTLSHGDSCNHQLSQDAELFHPHRLPHSAPWKPQPPPFLPNPWHLSATTLFSAWYFQNVIQMEPCSMGHFEVGFLSLSIIPLRSTQAVMCNNSSVLFIAELCSMVWVFHSSTAILHGFFKLLLASCILIACEVFFSQ